MFARTGSAHAVVAAFNCDKLLFPVRINTGARKGELAWMPLTHWRVLRTLHNPRYAGAFAYGRRTEATAASGKKTYQALPRDQWTALIPGAHPGYITWETYRPASSGCSATPPPAAPTGPPAPPAKEPRCCKDWLSAAGAGGG